GGGSNYFCVQRHDATRLHYDFRLEIDGVLKSWAVPKGPTLDPAMKHYAAHVEDHPVEYGSFEGNIPANNYGAGSVMLWDRGTFELLGGIPGDQQIARGDLKFRLHGEKLKGDFALVQMKGRSQGKNKDKDWLIIKKRDDFATPGWEVEAHAYSVLSGRTQEEIARNMPARKSKAKTAGASDRTWESRPAKRAAKVATAEKSAPKKKKPKADPSQSHGARAGPMPDAIEPMTANVGDRPPHGDDWLFEIKWDGVRAIAFVENEEVRLQGRSGLRCERQYPELAVLPHHLSASSAVLDGEIAVLDGKGVSRFHLIQPRIANSDPNAVAHLVRSTPVVYFAFDLLYLDGYDLRHVPLATRRELLEQVLEPGAVVRISEAFPGAGEALLDAARENGLEGIVAKRAQSLYESRRSREWLKIKIVTEQEFVIGGFTTPQGDRDHFGALVIGVHNDGKLHWVGNVGTGFDQKLLNYLAARLKPLATSTCPFVERPKPDKGMTWVKPELVCQVKFSNWTQDDRLRAPVFLGLRNDVPAPDVAREASSEFLSSSAKEASLTIDGHALKFTNLRKLYYPDDGVTKGDVLNYYSAVTDLILPYLIDRPLSLKRYPNGIKEQFFFQKETPDSYPSWLRTEFVDGINYVFAEDRASFLYLVNLGCIDHNPAMSRIGSFDNPDYVLIDLDPQECSYDMIIEAALLVKSVLDEIGLAGYPKTTGGDGMHIYIPLEPEYSYEEARQFAELISRLLVHQRPQMFTTPRSVAKRQRNRVYFDWMQIGRTKTISAPYVLRAYPGAPVATPLEWSEVKPGLDPKQFNIFNSRERFAEKGDLFRGVIDKPQNLYDAIGRMEKLFHRPQMHADTRR
ncbi:MAG TPA: DNA ligase D, partial [Candidatus Solibacter sp.]|nr:DNA ligase D [Candidatus Solibacter sp.]